MRIGVDIDGVLNDEKQFCIDYGTQFCSEFSFSYNISLSHWNSQDLMQWSDDAEFQFWNKYYCYYIARTTYVRPFAAEVIEELRSKNHTIHIISARNLDSPFLHGSNQETLTTKWLYDNRITFDSLSFTKEKEKAVTKLGIDVMIEDNPLYVKALASLIPVLCFHQEHNRNLNIKNIKRIYSWNEVMIEILKLQKSKGAETNDKTR